MAIAEKELNDGVAEWEEEKKYVEKNGFKNETELWDTTHNSTYDIRNKTLWVAVHEWYDKVVKFNL